MSESLLHQKYLDFGSLDSSVPPDLSLSSLHQPRLSLELVPSDLDISLPHINTCSSPPPCIQSTSSSSNPPSDHSLKLSQQLAYDLNRHPSKRWTSFSELGRSVLKLKSFERSTVHSSVPYLRPRLANPKPASVYSTTSASNHRSLFQLFHPDHPSSPSSDEAPSNSNSTLPILPPLSELLDGSTSFDKEFSSITDRPMILEDPPETSQSSTDPRNLSSTLIQTPSEFKSSSDGHNGPHLESQSQRAQSIVSSKSAPIVTFASPSSPPQTSNSPITSNQIHQVAKTAVNENEVESSPPKAILTIEESALESTVDQSVALKIPPADQTAQTEENQVDATDNEGATPNQDPLIEILNRSDDSKSNEDPTTFKLSNSPTHTPSATTSQQDSKTGGSGFLGKKKKLSESSGFFKLLLLKGLGHLKSGHSSSVPNDTSKTLVPTATIHNH